MAAKIEVKEVGRNAYQVEVDGQPTTEHVLSQKQADVEMYRAMAETGSANVKMPEEKGDKK